MTNTTFTDRHGDCSRVRIRHGFAPKNRRRGRVYSAWVNMNTRCRNPRRAQWADYGGRGITICERWESFENFLADMGEPSPGMTLDRIDVNKGYSPENCRWATHKEQRANRRDAVRVLWNGESRSLDEWAAILGVSRWSLRYRHEKGLPLVKEVA